LLVIPCDAKIISNVISPFPQADAMNGKHVFLPKYKAHLRGMRGFDQVRCINAMQQITLDGLKPWLRKRMTRNQRARIPIWESSPSLTPRSRNARQLVCVPP
jgi:hypothetical protein